MPKRPTIHPEKSHLSAPAPTAQGWPDAAALAALRAWYAGMSTRAAVEHYLADRLAPGASSRGVLSGVRRQLIRWAEVRHRDDLAALLAHPADQRTTHASAVVHAIERLRAMALPVPRLTDEVQRWLQARCSKALHAQRIRTLADLALTSRSGRRWWTKIPGLGSQAAKTIHQFFEAHPHLKTALPEPVVTATELLPWESLVVPGEVDGSRGLFRAPAATCALAARNDYEAVQAWLELQESAATRRSYRKEAERLMLWAIVERGKALSSLTTEDATQYRAMLRNPKPRARWVGPARPRAAADWRPFQGPLSSRSVSYALQVVGALYRWLTAQRYVLVNPFAGLKARGGQLAEALDASRAFTEHEWTLVRSAADHIEWVAGWREDAAHRLRFILDFWFATGLRPAEFVAAKLGDIRRDHRDEDWLHVVGKGAKAGKVSLPPVGAGALDRYLASRKLPVTRARWDPDVPLVPSLEGRGFITTGRLWTVMKRFFTYAAATLTDSSPDTAAKLRHATPHWLRHTHATYALNQGVELTTVRDNLRHSSVSTTSIYLHTDDERRARQMRDAFKPR